MMKKVGIIVTIVTMAALLLAAVSTPSYGATATSAGTSTEVAQLLQISTSDLSSCEKTDYSACCNIMAIGEKRLKSYNNAIAKSERLVASLQAKGVDTSAMESTMSDAQFTVIGPLADALESGDETLVANELRSKCLFNGAPYSFHFGAQMSIEGMTAITVRIEDRAVQAGYGRQIGEIKAHLATAQAALDEAGTSPYNEEQKKVLKEELRTAASLLKEVIHGLQNPAADVAPGNAVRKNTVASNGNAVMLNRPVVPVNAVSK
jgi:hypothetical protein